MKHLAVATMVLGPLLLATPPAGATVREWLMEQVGLEGQLLPSSPSVRLAGLGDVGLCVRDESNELNARDFAGNVAGILDDSDRWVVESWFGGVTQVAERRGLSSERRFGDAGFQAVQRSADRALGIDVNWTYFELDDKPGDWARVRGPLSSVIVNQRTGRFTFGFQIGRETENEDRRSTDHFYVRHRQDRWMGQLGVLTDLAGAVLCGEWEFERGDVKGKSVDPARFHEDVLRWARPLDRFTLALLLPAGGRIEGGLYARTMNRDGGETIDVSWSAESPWNPAHTDYQAELTTFRETEKQTELLSRWRYHLGAGTIFGVEGSYRDQELTVVEGVNFKGSASAGEWRTEQLAAAVGLSQHFLGGRLLAAVQVRGARADEAFTIDGSLVEQTTQDAIASGGFEYFAAEQLVFRGGVFVGSRDSNVDGPLSLRLAQGAQGGVSWLPRGGLVQLHLALKYGQLDPWDADALELTDETLTEYVLGMRLLL